ncbi:MAG: CIA30 family protein [Bacteroidota bacterium]
MSVFLLLLCTIIPPDEPVIIDFGADRSGYDWATINDRVMGGRSLGDAFLTDSSVVYEGTQSLENNGGFVSLRAPFRKYDLSEVEKITIRYKNEGIAFALQLEQDRRFYIPNYKQKLEKTGEGWNTVTVQLTGMGEYRVGGRTGRSLTEQKKSQLIRLGFISDEKKSGPYRLEIDWIKLE